MSMTVSANNSGISTHMPLARHDGDQSDTSDPIPISTHMPLARHDIAGNAAAGNAADFYSHASCEA